LFNKYIQSKRQQQDAVVMDIDAMPCYMWNRDTCETVLHVKPCVACNEST
jgi:hypothetical protein